MAEWPVGGEAMQNLVSERDFQEFIHHLQYLLKIDSSPKTGGQASIVRYVAGVLSAEGVQSRQILSPDGSLNLVARVSANKPDDGLIIALPSDVPVTSGQNWTHPPFSGVTVDDELWGPGVLDSKRALAMSIMLPVIAKRRRLKPLRDLLLLVTADGNGSGQAGIHEIIRQRPDLVKGTVALCGQGGHNVFMNERNLVPIRSTSMGLMVIKLRASSENGIFSLARALLQFEDGELQARMCAVGLEFLSTVKSILPKPLAISMFGLTVFGMHSFALKALDDGEVKNLAMLMNNDMVKIQGVYAGTTPGGFHPEPHAILAVQVLPGRSAQDVVQQISKLVQEDIAVEVLNEIPGVQVKTPHPFFHHLKESVKKAQSDAIVTQYGAFAGPEPHALATLDIPTYGFNPIKLPSGFNYQGRAGNVDESAPIEGIQEGFKLYTEAILNWCYTSH